MKTEPTAYGISATLDLSPAQAIEKTKAGLSAEGFGVLSEIDIANALKEKIGVDFPFYVILGACNPQLAHQALQQEIDIGLLLPCNVIVYEHPESGATTVAAMDPVAALAVTGNDAIGGVARDAKQRLERVIAGLRKN